MDMENLNERDSLEYLQYLIEKEENKVVIRFPELEEVMKNFMQEKCYRVLREIRDIVADPYLDEEECYSRVEEIVSKLEDIGFDCDSRHDLE